MPIDFNNPFAFTDPFARAAIARQPAVPSLPPEEEQSALSKIADLGLGGLGFIGGILNKPGRVVRGLLGGQPRELLNAIPFSDALGITDASQQVHGTDLLGISRDQADQAGFFSPEGLGGFAAELATDPLSFTGFLGGALSKAGKIAQKAAMLPKAISGPGGRLAGFAAGSPEASALMTKAHQLGVPLESAKKLARAPSLSNLPYLAGTDVLGGHVGFGLPFMGNNFGTFDLGPLGDAIGGTLAKYPKGTGAAIGAGVGGLSGAMSDEGNPLTGAVTGGLLGAGTGYLAPKVAPFAKDLYTRTVPPLFEAAVKGRTNEAAQAAARQMTGLEPSVFASTMNEFIPLAEKAKALGFADEAGSMALRTAGEVPGIATPVQRQVLDPLQKILGELPIERAHAGLPSPMLHPAEIPAGLGEGQTLGYLPRQTTPAEPKSLLDFMRPSMRPAGQIERMREFDGLTSDSLLKMSREDMGTAPDAIRQTIGDKYLGLPKWKQQVEDAQSALFDYQVAHQGVADPDLANAVVNADARYAALAEQADELARMKLAGKLPEFTNHVLKDAVVKTLKDKMDIMKATVTYEHLAKNVVAPGENTIPLNKAIRALWEPNSIAGDTILPQAEANVQAGRVLAPGHTPAGGADIRMMEALNKAGIPVKSLLDLRNLHVDKEFANQLAGLQKLGSVEGLQAFTKVWDSATNLTKAYQTSWPATVVRNMGQDVANKFFFDKRDPAYAWFNPVGYFKPISDWKAIANGGTVLGMAEKLKGVAAFKGMNDAEVAAELRKMYTAWDVGRSGVKSSAIAQGLGDVTEQGLRTPQNAIFAPTKTLPNASLIAKNQSPFPVQLNVPYTPGHITDVHWEAAPIQNVPIGELVSGQSHVNGEMVARIARGETAFASGETASAGLPMVVKKGGKYYIEDGTNRAAAEVLKGAPTVQAKVIDMDLASGLKPTVSQAGKDLESLLPISQQRGPLAAAADAGWRDLSAWKQPFGVSGVAGQTADVFPMVRAARQASNASDNLMRGSTWLASLEQGAEPALAFAETMKTHFDFANLSEVERKYLRRAIPYYGWLRQNVPSVVKEVIEQPGGRLANAIKGTVAMRGNHPGFLRPDVAEGVALPIGSEQDGTQRYLTHLGFGFEDIGQLLGPGGPIGTLNPLLKAPIEAYTGKQLFTGRDVRDLHSRLGDLTGTPLPVAENVLMNSPAGRFISTAGTLADPRKSFLDAAINLGTGARLSDVDVEASRRNAVRDYVNANLRGPNFRHFDSLSVRPGALPLLSPQELELFRLHLTQDRRSQAAARAR